MIFYALVKKTDFDDKLKNLNKTITPNKTKLVLAENKFKKLQTFVSGLFIGQSYFRNNGAKLYLIFQTLYYTLKRVSDAKKYVSWKSKGNSVSPWIKWYRNANVCLVFKKSCLKQKKTQVLLLLIE